MTHEEYVIEAKKLGYTDERIKEDEKEAAEDIALGLPPRWEQYLVVQPVEQGI